MQDPALQPERKELDVLMARLADGDRSVFAEVFRELWPAALRLCTSLCVDEADAADAAQQAMVKILERASDYDKTRPALPWALAIAAWECRTLKRWRFRRHEAPVDELSRSVGAGGEQDLVSRDLERAALGALGALSESDRETLLATYWDEDSSTSGATLRKRRERALGRLRSTFRRLYGLDE
jgi:RNA polymerase sigma-70 factor (ECF subfamily)